MLAAVAKAGPAPGRRRRWSCRTTSTGCRGRGSPDIIGLPLERVFLDNVPVTGHCFCADPFINYRTALDLGRLRPGDHYLIAAVGLGATFSAMVFEH